MDRVPPSEGRSIGVLGSGPCVEAIARRLAARVGSIRWFDPSSRVRALPNDARIGICASASELWMRSGVVISWVERETELRALLGECRGARARASPFAVLELTPISPSTQAELAAQCIEADVVLIGGRVAALAGASADRAALYVDDAALSQGALGAILDALACEVIPTGAAGSAKIVGMLIDLLVGVNTAISCEAIALGESAGIDASTLARLVATGSGANAVLARAGIVACASDEIVAEAHRRASLRAGIERASAAALQADHSLFFGSLAISSLLGRDIGRALQRSSAAGSAPDARRPA